ncbi:MAG: proline dehydrogenase family protein [Vicinamibacteria bacterium]
MSAFDRLLASSLAFVPKPVIRHFSRPYIAGETEDEMVAVMRRLHGDGFLTTVDVLGELTTDRDRAHRAVLKYLEVMELLAALDLGDDVSVKLTQIGLKIDPELAFENLRQLAAKAKERGSFVRIDMEDSSCTTDTLRIYHRLRGEYGDHVGPVIQAYLRRSLEDVRELAKVRASVRLCKGIYVEPRTIAYQDRELINRNYVFLLEGLLGAGCYVGIATHDERLVWEAARIIDRLGLEPSQYEFQMLLGVDEALRRMIRDAGHRLRVYVPFGSHWYAYSLRRLRENPRIAGYVVKNLFPLA